LKNIYLSLHRFFEKQEYRSLLQNVSLEKEVDGSGREEIPVNNLQTIKLHLQKTLPPQHCADGLPLTHQAGAACVTGSNEDCLLRRRRKIFCRPVYRKGKL